MALTAIINEVSKLYELEQVRVTVNSSLRGGLTVGCAATAGSLALGPVGLLIGGVLGSAVTSWSSWGKYKSLASIIVNDLTPKQQEQLVQSLQVALDQISKEDLLKLMILVAGSGAQMALRELAVNTVRDFAIKELGYHIC